MLMRVLLEAARGRIATHMPQLEPEKAAADPERGNVRTRHKKIIALK
jgi:hypothetical protein